MIQSGMHGQSINECQSNDCRSYKKIKSVGEITVGVMTVGVMRRPYLHVRTAEPQSLKETTYLHCTSIWKFSILPWLRPSPGRLSQAVVPQDDRSWKEYRARSKHLYAYIATIYAYIYAPYIIAPMTWTATHMLSYRLGLLYKKKLYQTWIWFQAFWMNRIPVLRKCESR
jgi:hypothetical protein